MQKSADLLEFTARNDGQSEQSGEPASDTKTGTDEADVIWGTMTCPHCKKPITTLEGEEGDPDFIYFIQRASGPIKIGLSKNPDQRRYSIMMDVKERVRIVAMIVGSRNVERSLHARFKHLRIRREWFSPAPELLAYIRKLPNNMLARP